MRVVTVACTQDRAYTFAAESAALLVIDMQRDFLDDDGMCKQLGESIDALRAIIPGLASVLEAARRSRITVIHTREGYAPDLSDMHPLKRERYAGRSEGPLGRFLIRGEPGQDIIPELYPRDGEPVIDKPGFGAFYRTDLEEILEQRGISHLILTGITTQCCVQSTLREAVDRGFYCLTLSDCCAAIDDELHAAAISLICGENHLFGWISGSSELLDALRPPDPRRDRPV